MSKPNWPTKLTSYAERGSFKLAPSDAANLRTSYDSGPARVRRRNTSAPAVLEFTISMREIDFEMFRSFYRDILNDGSTWFTMPIYTGGTAGYVDHEVRFVEHYSASDDGFTRVSVRAKLEVRGLLMWDGAAAWIMGEWGQTAIYDIADPLQIIVNIDYPGVMENY